ncbi:MAG: carbon storage regulator [Pirellulaceae bacterium]
MPVLSRRERERIHFPGLGISVEILEMKGSRVKVGVEAPIEVRVVRDELDSPVDAEPHVVQLPQAARHDLRNTLNELTLLLHVFRKRSTTVVSPSS